MNGDLVRLYGSDKTFPIRPVWKIRDTNNLQCIQALDVDGVTIEGLRFRATALTNRPDENVTFQIEYIPPRKQPRGGAMSRIEWRPLSAHNNKQIGPKHLRNVLQTGTHHHEFHECWKASPSEVRKGNLIVSIPIDSRDVSRLPLASAAFPRKSTQKREGETSEISAKKRSYTALQAARGTPAPAENLRPGGGEAKRSE